jgi:hypothetical protein
MNLINQNVYLAKSQYSYLNTLMCWLQPAKFNTSVLQKAHAHQMGASGA